ncbi:hypothetical protein CCR75_003551 [Bremia lactucae]|uniref:DNA-directed RNA polymerase n=1 Tax=Bremia lactucae TaxID=4779 RepID=A0A976IHD6_BRELC|nr:hypothetical protein CCR75_003551 [Bremia lactucae]
MWNSTSSGTYSSKFCPYHKNCLGHYQSVDGIALGLPPFCARVDDPKEMSDIDKLNIQLMQGSISALQFGVSLRNMVSGKRGLVKYKAMGFVPSTSMRGVASCHWDSDYNRVYVPRLMLSRIQVPTRIEKDGLTSPYFTSRSAKDGDYALMSRNPVLSHESIRVHPENCVPLNLDYDGDEVNLAIIDGKSCIDEAVLSIEANQLSKFSDDAIAKVLGGFGKYNQIDMFETCDFMTLSTMSITQVGKRRPNTRLHKLSRCKDELWDIVEDIRSDPHGRMSTFVSKSIKGIHDMTDSHLRVSEGFIIGRQLKHILMQTSSSDGVLKTGWCEDYLQGETAISVPESIPREPGFPGVKLSSMISASIQQALMDKAKHSVASDRKNMILSLLTQDGEFCISQTPDGEMKLRASGSPSNDDDDLVLVVSRDSLARIRSVANRFRKCFAAVRIGCETNAIRATDLQIAEFAHAVFVSTYHNADKSMTGPNDVKFLSATQSKSVLTAACNDIYELDSRRQFSRYLESMSECDVSQPILAIMTGNYAKQLHTSMINF